MSLKQNLIGNIYGRLTVISESVNTNDSRSCWLCKCECGNEKTIAARHLKSGSIKSCGCFHREVMSNTFITHGQKINGTPSTEYNTWASMKQRCYDKNSKNYKNYGCRGIKVCDRWKNSFENFFEDMGQKPSELYSIDRINVNGNYEPSNCKWATIKEQCYNRRSNKKFQHNGVTMILKEWATVLNTSSSNINYHLNRGKNFSDVFIHYANKN